MKADSFFTWSAGQQSGPHSILTMRQMLKDGRITSETLVMRNGDEDWLPLSSYDDIIPVIMEPTVAPPALSAPPAQSHRREPTAGPAPAPPAASSGGGALTAGVVREWLMNATMIFFFIGLFIGMLAAILMGMPGMWFCVGPLSLALTCFIFAQSKPGHAQ